MKTFELKTAIKSDLRFLRKVQSWIEDFNKTNPDTLLSSEWDRSIDSYKLLVVVKGIYCDVGCGHTKHSSFGESVSIRNPFVEVDDIRSFTDVAEYEAFAERSTAVIQSYKDFYEKGITK
jgi:hypothetical protein